MTGAKKQRRQLALRTLMDKASVQGYLTTDDLMEFFPDTSGDMERLSILLTALRRRGVQELGPIRVAEIAVAKKKGDSEPRRGFETLEHGSAGTYVAGTFIEPRYWKQAIERFSDQASGVCEVC